MSTLATRPTRPPGAVRLSLADITTKSRGLPSRVIAYGVPGIGKTSFPAWAPSPIFLMSKQETGLESLKDAGLVPESVANFPEIENWAQSLQAFEVLTKEEHTYKTLVVDTMNGMEKMCHDFVCQRDYNGKYSSFTGYQAGFKVAVGDWREFLSALDKLRETKRMGIILLAHCQVKNFRNPEGPDFDRYIPDMDPATWSVTHGWADMVLFMNYDNPTEKERGQAKAKPGSKSGSNRLIYTSRTAAWDAKNRINLPEVISMGESGQEAWTNFTNAIKTARGGVQ